MCHLPNHWLRDMSQSIRSHPKWPRLVDLVRELAFIDGGSDDAFTLASGRQSRWFFDTKPVMMHPEASHIIGEMLNIRMDELQADFVGGLELGAVPLTAIAVTMSARDSPRRGFMVRKEAKVEAEENQQSPGNRGLFPKVVEKSLLWRTLQLPEAQLSRQYRGYMMIRTVR